MSNKKLIIYTFGTSDLYVDGKIFGKDEFGKNIENFNFEKETGILKDNFKEHKISFPIFESLIKKLGKDYNYQILGIFTKQDQIYRFDTHNLEKIFDKYLQKNNFLLNFKLSKNNIILNEAQKISVIFNKINNFFQENEKFFDNFEEILVNITGGTKGIILGTFQAVISNFNIEKVNFFSVNEENNNAIELRNIKTNITKNNYKKNIKLLIENYDFLGLYIFTKDKESFNLINKIAEYTYKMLDFEVEEANILYNNLEELGENMPFFFKKEYSLKLSIDGIIFTYKTGRLVEFMGRIYSFSDILLSYILKEKLSINLGEEKQYKELKKYVKENEELEEFLNNYKIEKNFLDWDIEKNERLKEVKFLNTIVKKTILEYFIEKENEVELELFLNFLKKLQKLNKLRNKTIIAHGIEGVSKEKIKENFDGDIEEEFKKVYNFCGFGDNFFIYNVQEKLFFKLKNIK